MSWPARTVCGVLDDMRKCYKTYNFSAIASLIEECQMLANRMEANLDTKTSYEDRRIELRKINKKIKDAEKKLEEVTKEKK